jgi:hypothetical protein
LNIEGCIVGSFSQVRRFGDVRSGAAEVWQELIAAEK